MSKMANRKQQAKNPGQNGDPNNYSFPYMRTASTKTGWESFRSSLWNSEDKTVLGRTGKSWVQLAVFYLLFYSVLCALFAICMKGLLATISESEPSLKLGDSRIGTNPGLGFRPLSERTEEGSLIWYDAKNETQITRWANLLDDFLKLYLHKNLLPGGGLNQMLCDFDTPPLPGKVCEVNVKSWDPCTPDKSYGYNMSSPCIFLKINKIYDWVPEFYDDPKDLPAEMPEDLKEHINNLPEKERKQVWISCSGDSPVDKELLNKTGSIEYVRRGFPSYYFPYKNTLGYLSPLAAVQIVHPPLNQIINIECRAWAKNVIYIGGEKDRQGSVHFEIMID